jgi:tRNA (cmo5U34)-methyltransferase
MTDTNAEIWKSEEVARSFAAQSAQRERDRAEQLTFVARLLPFDSRTPFTFVDLGAGTGAASRALLHEYPRSFALLAEYSEQMAAEGRKLLTEFDGRYRYVAFDMLEQTWQSVISERVDAVVSALAIHHLPDARKRSIFGEIRAALKPGGWFINYDPIRAPDEPVESVWERVNLRYDPNGAFRRDAKRSPQEQLRYENHVRYMIPLAPQLSWLAEAGFVDIDVFWKRLDWVIYGGRSPG